jgi:3-phenylpropionate/trans-cinnamate dioxygenase ferredoxin subunit
MRQFIAIATTDELHTNEMKAFEHEGRRLLLVNANGEFFLVDEMCTHEDY